MSYSEKHDCASLSFGRYFLVQTRRASTICLFLLVVAGIFSPDRAAGTVAEAPLTIGNRTLHIFRAPLGAFSPQDRVDGARQRILQAFEKKGDGWTSIKPTPQGIMIELDGAALFYILPGDARESQGETAEELANQASRTLQKAWSESRESRNHKATIRAMVKVLIAFTLLVIVILVIISGTRRVQHQIKGRLIQKVRSSSLAVASSRMARLLPRLASRFCSLLAWLIGLVSFFVFCTYSLEQFVLTRPASEELLASLHNLSIEMFNSITAALPGMFIAVLIFLGAWVVTQISTELFHHYAETQTRFSLLDSHTAPATRRIANASLWLFAFAMAYPYLPGSHTEAFKGVSVILGLMVSIGASGVVGQISSGLMLVYTHALLVGEYVKIEDCEGTVTELGLFVTRLRTGTGEEVSLPNSLVLANVTRNFSRTVSDDGFVLDTTVTIGYDTPWRQVHALLLEAVQPISEIRQDPAPFVVQTALSDFYVEYKLVAQVSSDQPAIRAQVISRLHGSIQDVFNRNGVQIMSPHYVQDPAETKTVPESNWYVSSVKMPADMLTDSEKG